jgi:hypothetical protein
MPPTALQMTAVRREAIGTATDTTIITDDDITHYWDEGGAQSVLLTAALCCEMVAARVGGARVAIASVSGVSVNRQTQPAELRRRASELRRRYLNGDGALAGSASTAVRAVWADSDDAFDDDEDEFAE